jgi:hypothetical protein
MAPRKAAALRHRRYELEREIRAELRAIVRQYEELGKPLDRFDFAPGRPASMPAYYVAFDMRQHKRIHGLVVRVNTITVPDETITGRILQFAQSVWHLKDRLRQFAKATASSVQVEEAVQQSPGLLVCGDLANWKKHGVNENRSGLTPRLDAIRLDTSRNGLVEFFYDSATRHKELLVVDPRPIPFTVDILINDGSASFGNAVDLIWQAFRDWLPVIKSLGLLESDDGESRALKEALFPVEEPGAAG